MSAVQLGAQVAGDVAGAGAAQQANYHTHIPGIQATAVDHHRHTSATCWLIDWKVARWIQGRCSAAMVHWYILHTCKTYQCCASCEQDVMLHLATASSRSFKSMHPHHCTLLHCADQLHDVATYRYLLRLEFLAICLLLDQFCCYSNLPTSVHHTYLSHNQLPGSRRASHCGRL